MKRWIACVVFWGLLGCAPAPPDSERAEFDAMAIDVVPPEAGAGDPDHALVVGEGWRIAGPGEDPFAPPMDPLTECESDSHREEYGGVEVDTGFCEYVSLVQPLRRAVVTGETLRVVGWHSNLFAPELMPVSGRIALAIGPEIVWEQTVSIPADPATWDARLQSPVDAAVGTLVTLRVQNHGANTWNILSFETVPLP